MSQSTIQSLPFNPNAFIASPSCFALYQNRMAKAESMNEQKNFQGRRRMFAHAQYTLLMAFGVPYDPEHDSPTGRIIKVATVTWAGTAYMYAANLIVKLMRYGMDFESACSMLRLLLASSEDQWVMDEDEIPLVRRILHVFFNDQLGRVKNEVYMHRIFPGILTILDEIANGECPEAAKVIRECGEASYDRHTADYVPLQPGKSFASRWVGISLNFLLEHRCCASIYGKVILEWMLGFAAQEVKAVPDEEKRWEKAEENRNKLSIVLREFGLPTIHGTGYVFWSRVGDILRDLSNTKALTAQAGA